MTVRSLLHRSLARQVRGALVQNSMQPHLISSHKSTYQTSSLLLQGPPSPSTTSPYSGQRVLPGLRKCVHLKDKSIFFPTATLARCLDIDDRQHIAFSLLCSGRLGSKRTTLKPFLVPVYGCRPELPPSHYRIRIAAQVRWEREVQSRNRPSAVGRVGG